MHSAADRSVEEERYGLKQLTTDLSVCGQVGSADLDSAEQAGFRAIICNRPDKEGPDQTPFGEIERAAKQVGLEARYLP